MDRQRDNGMAGAPQRVQAPASEREREQGRGSEENQSPCGRRGKPLLTLTLRVRGGSPQEPASSVSDSQAVQEGE